MSMTMVVKQAATLNAGHPFTAILVAQPQADVSDTNASALALTSAATLMSGNQDFDQPIGGGGQGLTAAGVAAIAGAFNTYVSGLSATKKAQVGPIRAIVTSTGLALTVHATDVASMASTLQSSLNSNNGTIGS